MNILKQFVYPFFTRAFLIGCCACVALVFTACDKDDDRQDRQERTGKFFLAVKGESAEYILRTDYPESGTLSIADNSRTLEQSGYTWIFDSNASVALGLIYRQGDPGIGLAYTLSADGFLQEPGQFQISSRFTSYGFFDRYALTSVGGQALVEQGDTLLNANGAKRDDGVTFNFIDLRNGYSLQEKTIATLNITGNGDQATFSGIVDMGNGEFLTGLVVSQPRDPQATGGASSGTVTHPDSVWVAAFDADLKLKRIYRDDRISYSSGRYRSQYYSQIGKADNGDVYVFSGSYEATTQRPCGALRIRKEATDFDDDYYFNIEEKTSGYHFRKVWHIAGNCFLLELYNDLTVSALGAASQYGVVDMEAKTFTWVTGIPAKDKIIATGLPASFGGKMYFPITAEASDPAVYIIDPITASAVKGMSVTGASNITAIGRIAP
jgi:hypothetical protein